MVCFNGMMVLQYSAMGVSICEFRFDSPFTMTNLSRTMIFREWEKEKRDALRKGRKPSLALAVRRLFWRPFLLTGCILFTEVLF